MERPLLHYCAEIIGIPFVLIFILVGCRDGVASEGSLEDRTIRGLYQVNACSIRLLNS